MLIYNAQIINEGTTKKGFVIIKGERIAEVGTGMPSNEMLDSADETIDAKGAWLIPGVIDTHVHFRDPGLTNKGDIASESKAALEGGVTSYIDMPNTIPPTTDLNAWEEKMQRAADCSAANYAFFIGATNNNLETLKNADYSRIPGVKLFLGSSTGNMLVNREEMILRLMREVDTLIAVHAEDETLIRQQTELAIQQFGGKENVPLSMHPQIRSRSACLEATRRAVDIAKVAGARLHVCHLSTAEEAGLFIPGPTAGKRITCETAPHYLLFNDSDYSKLGTRIKCNPSIKEEKDRIALIDALNDDRIDSIATDHAPHLLKEKQGGALTAASGMPGIRYSLRLMLEMTRNGIISKEKVVEKMCHNPAVIFGIKERGYIRPGYYADIVIVRSDEIGETILDTSAPDKCGWTPYIGMLLHHKIEHVFINGKEAKKGGKARELEFIHARKVPENAHN